ncbi:PREDICTED: WD repeat-containing protein 78 [Nanorana parkeri]|uniref:WD repeat-containing protein 78 n=1 Tax=Nanorana parkeri TaxID=125878 RepID=UPI0008550AFA|nr:PREDICTED: WD repeat-containing protein 78 [Nanorana parkeri]
MRGEIGGTGNMSGLTRSRVHPRKASVPKMASHVKKIINMSSFVTQSRANRSMMGSRKSVSLHADSKFMDKNSVSGGKQIVPVFDEEGNDVTPRSLFQAEPGAAAPKPSKFFTTPDASGIMASDIFSTMSLQQTGTSASFVGPFSRSIFGGSSMSMSSQEAESISEDAEEPGRAYYCFTASYTRKEEVREPPKEEDLEKTTDVQLTETETIWLLDVPLAVIAADSEEAETVNVRNQTYTELCKSRAGNDRYVERTMQTFNGAPKSKEVQCESIIHQDAGVMASVWDLYDSFNAPEQPQVEAVVETVRRPESVASNKSSMSQRNLSVVSMDVTDMFSSTVTDLDKLSVSWVTDEAEPDPDVILTSEKFQQDLFIMERVVVENIYQPKLAAYRQLPVIIDPDSTSDTEVIAKVTSPSLDRLWSFVCDTTKGHNVSSTSWNKKNPDLLAVGYGQFGFKEQKGGLACCWSLKNTTWPERIFHCESGVTAVDFSATRPNLLAVGMYDGTVAIYDVQKNDDVPVLGSSDNLHKHTCPVWQLKWIEQDHNSQGEDNGEILVSICGDGRITRWQIRKGLECRELMKLKRTGSGRSKKSSGEKEKKGEALISRQAPGMCFDFLPVDSNIYLAGTEEGHIHKCSCSYNEQFLDTYKAHKGPVYKLVWSPFCPDVFLSCSADWCIHLWRQDILKPILTFSATTNAVHDIMWSPTSPLVFGAVNEDRVEIWDLDVSILDPIIVSSAKPGVRLTTLLFAKNTNCVLIGDSNGQVSVYTLRNVSSLDTPKVNALYDVIGATLASQL